MDLLDKDKILQLIDDTREDFELEIHQQLDSTNSYLLTQQLTDKVKICLAESQTAGRGRHGRSRRPGLSGAARARPFPGLHRPVGACDRHPLLRRRGS